MEIGCDEQYLEQEREDIHNSQCLMMIGSDRDERGSQEKYRISNTCLL
jgi:hypothetical protein